MKTKYFGEYVEYKDNDIPVVEMEGQVKVRDLHGRKGVYLWQAGPELVRYDLPHFMQSYNEQTVVLLARPYAKKVGERVYNKLVVVAAKVKPQVKR